MLASNLTPVPHNSKRQNQPWRLVCLQKTIDPTQRPAAWENRVQILAFLWAALTLHRRFLSELGESRREAGKRGRVYAKITEADIIRPPAMKVDFPNLSDSIPQIISKNSIPSVDTKARIPQSKTDTPTDVKNNGTMLSSPNITPRKKTIRYAKENSCLFLLISGLPAVSCF